jgi:parallel beta-helix repeat protein
MAAIKDRFSNQLVFVTGFLGMCLVSLPLAARTVCVCPGGGPGCYGSIAAAMASVDRFDTVRVKPGVYKESVRVSKAISLIADSGAMIDATGLANGIVVDGLSAPGLSDVLVSGFTIQNANFEGILVVNASAVTISSNQVLSNNKALANGTCPGLPSWQTNEQTDCGQGIHLQGADHAIVSNNVSQGNSGGILLSDDTGANHDNLVTGNSVHDNAWASGITLASHKADLTTTKSAVPLGVFHNTISGNSSEGNGLSNGAGAGIGILACVPSAKSYGNVVINNTLTGNGLPGVAMHANGSGQDLSNNMIAGNAISDNGADFGDAATTGPTGINIAAAGPLPGTVIAGNSIQNEQFDVVNNTSSPVQVHLNNLVGSPNGVANLKIGMIIGAGQVDATANWWGCPKGPGVQGCTNTMGPNIVTLPALTAAVPEP